MSNMKIHAQPIGKDERTAYLMLVAVGVIALAIVWKVALGRNLNDFQQRQQDVRRYSYHLTLAPEHPKAGDQVTFQIQITDRESGRPAASTDYMVVLSEPQRGGWVSRAPDLIRRERLSTDGNGVLLLKHTIDTAGEFWLAVVPAAGADNSGALLQEEERHPEYRGQPEGPRFTIYVNGQPRS
jgi:hypothetical protein